MSAPIPIELWQLYARHKRYRRIAMARYTKKGVYGNLILTGTWLVACGFPPGARIEITIKDFGLMELRNPDADVLREEMPNGAKHEVEEDSMA